MIKLPKQGRFGALSMLLHNETPKKMAKKYAEKVNGYKNKTLVKPLRKIKFNAPSSALMIQIKNRTKVPKISIKSFLFGLLNFN